MLDRSDTANGDNTLIGDVCLQVQGSLIAALRHSCEGVKVAACACVRSLSRSVKVSCAASKLGVFDG
jgi:hypothetical protein